VIGSDSSPEGVRATCEDCFIGTTGNEKIINSVVPAFIGRDVDVGGVSRMDNIDRVSGSGNGNEASIIGAKDFIEIATENN
jgi:hypothetical protein